MAAINVTAFSDALKTLYDKRLLAVAVPRFVHGRWAEVGTFTGYSAVEFRKYGLMDVVTTALSGEGVTPDESRAPALSTTTLTPSLYGAWLGYTKEIQIKAFDPILSEMINRLGEQAALSVDTLVRNTMVGSATTDYAGGATTVGNIDTTNDKVSFTDVLANITELKAAEARPADGPYFPVIIHPYTFATLMQDTMFQRTSLNLL